MVVELTSCGIQPAPALVTLEMLRPLMQGENFQVVEVALAVVAPWPGQDLVQARSTSLLAHCAGGCKGISVEVRDLPGRGEREQGEDRRGGKCRYEVK